MRENERGEVNKEGVIFLSPDISSIHLLRQAQDKLGALPPEEEGEVETFFACGR